MRDGGTLPLDAAPAAWLAAMRKGRPLAGPSAHRRLLFAGLRSAALMPFPFSGEGAPGAFPGRRDGTKFLAGGT